MERIQTQGKLVYNGFININPVICKPPLVPEGTKPLPELMLAYHKRCSGIQMKTISQIVLMKLFCKMCLEITF